MLSLSSIHALQPSQPASVIEQAITVWLDAVERRSGSVRSVQAYRSAITAFRSTLASVGLDLDADSRAVALVAQRWAWAGQRGDVAPATAAHRLNVVSSFYAFCQRRGLAGIAHNPIAQLDRPRVQAYAKARALDPATAKARLAPARALAAQGDVQALRDVAFCRVALTTGRRLGELAGLRWRDLTVTADGITVQWRTKGGKLMRDALAPDVARDLLRYLAAVYGNTLGTLAGDAPIWVRRDGRALTAQACGDIIRRWLHINPHATRHTYAHAMRRAGAADSVIQQRLGHSSLATTGRYLASLESAYNPYGDALAAMF